MTTSGLITARPAHIPAAAVYDFDIFHDAALQNDPHERVGELSRAAPSVFWTPRNGGHWLVLGFAEAHTVFRAPEIYSSALVPPELMQAMLAGMPADAPRFPMPTPIIMDPPEHTKYRLPLQRAFAPKTISALQNEITALAHSLIDGVVDKNGCEFIAAVAEQFPVRVFLRMMGLPSEKLMEFRALARKVFAPRERENEFEVFLQLRNIADAMKDVILARREQPQQDLISLLWSLEVDGEPISFELMEDYAVLLFLAGLDTVVIAISFGMYHLARHSELQNTLRANPEMIPEAVEELLRRYSFAVPVRRVAQDTELSGWNLKEGDRIMLYLPAIDLDACEFPNPEKFDISRENKAHMLFGGGPHRCLGSHLARLELQTLYRIVLERLPNFRLDPDNSAQFHVGQNLSLTSLPIRWD